MQPFKTLKVLPLILLGLAAGCGSKSSTPMAFPTPEVGVITVSAQTVPVTAELPGRIDAVRMAEVRARATGILLKRVFVEGADRKSVV